MSTRRCRCAEEMYGPVLGETTVCLRPGEYKNGYNVLAVARVAILLKGSCDTCIVRNFLLTPCIGRAGKESCTGCRPCMPASCAQPEHLHMLQTQVLCAELHVQIR